MAKLIETSRLYEKRDTEKSTWSGRIGQATLAFTSKSDIVVTLDGKELPEASIAHLVNFALQTLQDAYAGSANLAEAVGAFETKRDKLYNGTIGARGGSAESEETIVQRMVAREAYMASAKVSDADKKSLAAKIKAGEADDFLDNLWAKNAEKLADRFTTKIAEREAARKARAESKALAAKVELDI